MNQKLSHLLRPPVAGANRRYWTGITFALLLLFLLVFVPLRAHIWSPTTSARAQGGWIYFAALCCVGGADTPTARPRPTRPRSTKTPGPTPSPTHRPPRPTRTPIPEGLLSNQIQTVGFDDRGNAWIGTDRGISVRHHGDIWQYGEWTNYVRANSRLTSNNIRAICFDPFGYVWFGTEGGGANRLEPEDETWTNFSPANSGLASTTVDVIACDEEGTVWFGTPSGLSRRSASGTWSTYDSGPVAGRRIQAITVDQAGQVWFGIRGGGVARLSPQGEWVAYTAENSGLPGNDVRAITYDQSGNVWFGLWGGGVSKLSPTGAWTTFNLNNSGLVSLYIHAIAADVAGHVWIGTWNGINRITSDGSWITYTTRNSGLADDQVETIGFDQEGNVWFGTRGGGISVLVGGVTVPESVPTTTPTATPTYTRIPRPPATPSNTPVATLTITPTPTRTVTATPTHRLPAREVYLPLVSRNTANYLCRDNHEPNDSRGEATSLVVGQSIHALICPADDRDIYALDMSTLDPIVVEMKGLASGTNFDMWLYDVDGTALAGSTNDGNADERIDYEPAHTGRYYLMVFRPVGTPANIGPYNLSYYSSQMEESAIDVH